MRVYLDNAASTPMSSEVVDVMVNLLQTTFANPSSVHEDGRQARVIIEKSRSLIADIIHAPPGSIFFTSSGTEADNMAIQCSISSYNIKHAVTSPLSHYAVLNPLRDLVSTNKIKKLSFLRFNNAGVIDLDHLEELLINNERTFVSIMHANNEIGTIQPLKEIGDICNKYNAIFHSDTVQTIGHYPFDIRELNIDFLTASAHKFHGPKGVGFIYINKELKLSPFLKGGGQERNMRSGTENVYGIAGIGKAMELAYSSLDNDIKYIKALKLYMIQEIKKAIPSVEFYGNCHDLDNSLYTILSVNFPQLKGEEMLLFNLDIMGISCSGGSACSSGSTTKSHVISTLDPNSNRPSLRFSFSKYNTRKEINYTIRKLKELFI